MGNQQSSRYLSGGGVPVQLLELDRPDNSSDPEAGHLQQPSTRRNVDRSRLSHLGQAENQQSQPTRRTHSQEQNHHRYQNASWRMRSLRTSSTSTNHHSSPLPPVDLEHVQTAWRSFKGWDTRKLSLGMHLQPAEWHYLVQQMRPLPPCFRPKKLHLWDNSSSVQLASRHPPQQLAPEQHHSLQRASIQQQDEHALEFVQLCQTNVQELELHGCRRVPPLEHVLKLSISDKALFQWTNLKSLRLYHLDLRAAAAGESRNSSSGARLVRQVFMTPSSSTDNNDDLSDTTSRNASTSSPLLETLSLSRCHVDDETIDELASGIRNLGNLKTLIVVHCQLTDALLQKIMDSIVSMHQTRQQCTAEGGRIISQSYSDSKVSFQTAPSDSFTKTNAKIISNTSLASEVFSGSMDVCFHSNQLTLASLDLMVNTLVECPSLMRSITLHANPGIANSIGAVGVDEYAAQQERHSSLLRDEQSMQSPLVEKEWVRLWQILEDCPQLALRHLTWHECRRSTSPRATRTGRIRNRQQLEEERGGTQVVVCAACQRLNDIFQRNQMLATSNKLVTGVEQCSSSIWPRMMEGKSPTTLFGLVRGKHVELLEAAKRHSRTLHCLCPTCRVGGIGWCCRQEMQTFDNDDVLGESLHSTNCQIGRRGCVERNARINSS